MSVIDDYLQQFEPPVRTELERIRSIAVSLLPNWEETIAYGMPTIKYQGKTIIGFAARKKHIGIYPFSGQVISKIQALNAYDTTKGAIHEKFDQPLPQSLLEEIIRERIKQAGLELNT